MSTWKPKLDETRARIEALEKTVQEQEPSFLRAVKTFTEQLHIYQHADKDSEFPWAAARGVIYSYMRPRIVLVFGATVIGILQVFLLWNQNTLMKQQTVIIEEQTSSNQLEAIVSIVSNMRSEHIPSSVKRALLSNLGVKLENTGGFVTLLSIAESKDETGLLALSVLSDTYTRHDRWQAQRSLRVLLDRFFHELKLLTAVPTSEGASETFDWDDTRYKKVASYLSRYIMMTSQFALAEFPPPLDRFDWSRIRIAQDHLIRTLAARAQLGETRPQHLVGLIPDEPIERLFSHWCGASVFTDLPQNEPCGLKYEENPPHSVGALLEWIGSDASTNWERW